MKATLEFSLPEEAGDVERALLAPHMSSALHDIRRMFRDTIKYDEPPKSAIDLQQEFLRIIDDHGIKLDI